MDRAERDRIAQRAVEFARRYLHDERSVEANRELFREAAERGRRRKQPELVRSALERSEHGVDERRYLAGFFFLPKVASEAREVVRRASPARDNPSIGAEHIASGTPRSKTYSSLAGRVT